MKLIAKLNELLEQEERAGKILPELLRVAIEATKSLDEDDRPSPLWDAVDELREKAEAA